MKPALRIVFAPCFMRDKKLREAGLYMHGYTRQPGTRTVYLDPRGSQIGLTLLHEMMHVRHPSWDEKTIETETARRWAGMTWKQKAAHYRMLGSARVEGEE